MADRYQTPPSLKDHTFRVGPLSNLPEILRSFGCDPKPVFTESGFNLEQFEDPDTRISFVAGSRLLARCVTLTSCHHFGLLLGQRAVPSHLGIAGFLVRTAPNVGIALRNLVEYLDLHDQGGAPTLTIRGDVTLLGYAIHEPGVKAADQIYDLSITLACNIMRALCNSNWNPTQVLLSRSQPCDLAPYRLFFRAPLRFGAEVNAVVFPTSWLSHKVPSGDPLLHKHLEKEANELHSRNPANLTGELRMVLNRCLEAGKVSAGNCARQLGIQERTMNRRLQAEGTSFQKELGLIRYSLSQQLLSETNVPVREIATLLGYAESSVFCRAFKRWSGITPIQWRRCIHTADKPDFVSQFSR